MTRIALVTLFLLVACGSKKQEAPKDEPKVVEPTKPTLKDPTPQELVTNLASCADYAVCSNLEKPLVKAGPAIAPDLVKIVVDGTKTKDQREIAANVLVELKVAGTGTQLFEAAKAEKDFLIRGPIYKAAGASGDDAVFEAAKAHLMTEVGWDDRIEVNKAIVPFGKKTFEWAAANIVKTKKFSEVSRYGDLISQTATAGDVPAMQALLGAVKDNMARDDIAEALIKLGDVKAFDVLAASLASKDDLERNNAAKVLGSDGVIEKVPAERKAEFFALVESGKANDKSSTYTRWDEILGKLK